MDHHHHHSPPPPMIPSTSRSSRSPRVQKGNQNYLLPGKISDYSSALSPRAKRLMNGWRLANNSETSNALADKKMKLINEISAMFDAPYYGGQEHIIQKYLTFQEAKKECAVVGCVWKCDDSVYYDYMPPPPLPNKRDKDWIYSSVFYAAMDDENDVFPDKLENLINILCEVIYSYCILF